MQHILHTIAPVFTGNSRALILGTMPSPKSRENGFYYGHPQNRFWRTLSSVFDEPLPVCTEEKISFLLRHDLAMWDVLYRCDILGASDASIRNPIPNDIASLLSGTQIQSIFTTGTTATQLYRKLVEPTTKMPCLLLPSTSPANARMTLSTLTAAYSILLTVTDVSH
ncbi:MAG: DNA-deoxyinosine glycosylase [Clostridia bacterium]